MILVRHARSVVDADVAPADWALAADALAAAAVLGRHLEATRVVASTERKAIGTAEALALGPVETSDAFCEVTRPWYGDGDELRGDAERWFAGESVEGWEPRTDAVDRFDDGVRRYDGGGLVVVTHGTAMTAWLAWRRLVDDPFAFWTDLRMPDAFAVSGDGVRRYPAAWSSNSSA